VQLTWRTRRYTLRRPLRSAWGELAAREIVEVELAANDGRVGRGEAAPLEPYDGVALASVLGALDAYSAVLRVLPGRVAHAEVLDACAAERALPQALAAIDLALWDLDGQRAARPAAHLIAAGAARSIPVNAVARSAEDAAEAVRAGFRCVKLKVGLADDVERVAAVRAAIGPDVELRVDANGAWDTPREALAWLGHFTESGVALCEEPVHGVEALAEVRASSPIPIAMDETHAPGSGAADYVCLKISRSGGISGVLADAALAREAGSKPYLASTFDGPAGIAAGLQAAAALDAVEGVVACGLATLSAFAEITSDPFPVVGGAIALPDGEGLGPFTR
jgi:L-alanine-DL-glutamate epimerase-like enolase superfamily enzyme